MAESVGESSQKDVVLEIDDKTPMLQAGCENGRGDFNPEHGKPTEPHATDDSSNPDEDVSQYQAPFEDWYWETTSESSHNSNSSATDDEQLCATADKQNKSYNQLIQAISRNDHVKVRTLLSENNVLHIQRTEKGGRNPLHVATKLQHKKCIQELLRQAVSVGANCNEKDKFLNMRDTKNEETPLHIAVRIGWPAGVQLLLENGADITVTATNKKTVLHLALTSKKSPKIKATKEDTTAVLEILLKHEKCHKIINEPDEQNMKPLFCSMTFGCDANRKNNDQFLKILLQHEKIDLEARDRYGRPALYFAAETKQPALVSTLIEYITNNGTESSSQLTEFLEGTHNMGNLKKGTALHMAVHVGCSECVKLLLDAGSDITKHATFKIEDHNVFHLAALQKNGDVVSVLVKHLQNLKKKKKKLIKNIYVELLRKENVLKTMENTKFSRATLELHDINVNLDNINKKLEAVDKSKLNNDPSIWINPNSTSGAKDKRETIENNSQAVLNLLNDKNEILDTKHQKLLENESEGQIKAFDDTHTNNMREEIFHIDRACAIINELSIPNKRSPLQIAFETQCRESIKLLIQEGADVTATSTGANRQETTLIDRIMHCVPSSVELFEEVFDSSVKLKKEYVEVDYKILLPDNSEENNFKVLDTFLSTGDTLGQRKLLAHPLVQSFLQLQWQKLRMLYAILILLYLGFVLSLNGLLYTMYIAATRDTFWVNACSILTGISLILIVLHVEIYYVCLIKTVWKTQKKEFFIKVICYVLVLVLIFCTVFEIELPREVAVVAVALSMLEFIYLISHIPRYGNNLLIFIQVALNYFLVILSFSGVVIQFAIVFMVLFARTEPSFDEFTNSFTKTLVMMNGEMEYDALFQSIRPTVGSISLCFVQFVIIMFIFLGGTVLVNLLIAKAVIEVKQIDQLRIQAMSMSIYEKIFFQKSCTKSIHGTVIFLMESVWAFIKNIYSAYLCCNISSTYGAQWRANPRVVFKLQLNIMDRSSRRVPIEDDVFNLILDKGYANEEKTKEKYKQEQQNKHLEDIKRADREELLAEMKKIVLATTSEVIRKSGLETRNNSCKTFKSVVSTVMDEIKMKNKNK